MMKLHCYKHCVINVITRVAHESSFHRYNFRLASEFDLFNLYTCTVAGNVCAGYQEREQIKKIIQDPSNSHRSCILHYLVLNLENWAQPLRTRCDRARKSFDNSGICLTIYLSFNLPVLLVVIYILSNLVAFVFLRIAYSI